MSALMGVSNFKTMWVGWPGRVRTKLACTCMHAYKVCCTHVHAIHTGTQLIILDLKMQHSLHCIRATVGKVSMYSAY